MTSLPTALYRCNQINSLDKAAIRMQDIKGFELMRRAGQCAFDLVQHKWPETSTITVFCGGGNNAGDGYVVAALAMRAGFSVQVLTLLDPQKLTGDALLAFELAKSCSVSISPFIVGVSEIKGVLVDALLGIGISGTVREDYAVVIKAINASSQPVLAIDIPSGICGDTGRVLGSAVVAHSTITFIGLKQGMFTADACDHCGDINYAALGVAVEVYATEVKSCERLEFAPPLLPARPPNSHKGLFGRVVLIAGDKNYGGAGIMAAEATLLTGAGLVTLATHSEHVVAALARRPELMVSGIDSVIQLEPLLDQADVLVIGPGVGQSVWSKDVVECGLRSKQMAVVDADGLNILASQLNAYAPRDNWVLTPHPAEAGRLLGITTAQVQENRFAAAKALQQRYGGVIVLKGAGTIIADQDKLYLCSAGNPSMSTPGMGDILSGIIGGLLAQGLSLSESARLGVWAHATAADRVTQNKHMLATDIYRTLPALW
jgi:NAD(P)H-hydrate epimerase